MFDARQVLETVREGMAPSGWQVLHARPGYFVGEGVFHLALSLIAVTLTLIALLIFVVVGLHSGLGWFVLTLMLVFGSGALTAGLVVDAAKLLKRTPSARQEVFVLMPEGCVQGTIDTYRLAHAVDYSRTLDITLQVGATRAGPVVSLSMLQKGVPP